MHSVNLKNNVHLKCNKLIDHEFISNDKTHNFTENSILKLTSVSSCNANTYILQQTVKLNKFS